MSINGPSEINNKASQGRPEGGFLGLLHSVALIAVAVGAVGSVGLTLRAGRSAPLLLQVLFAIWVLSPFVILTWAHVVSKRWSVLTRVTLYCVTLLITLGALVIYGSVVLPPVGAPRAFVFVVTPPGAWLLLVIGVPLAALISRRRSSRGAGG